MNVGYAVTAIAATPDLIYTRVTAQGGTSTWRAIWHLRYEAGLSNETDPRGVSDPTSDVLRQRMVGLLHVGDWLGLSRKSRLPIAARTLAAGANGEMTAAFCADPEPDVRAAAALGLRTCQEPRRVAPALLPLLTADSDSLVRWEALTTVEAFVSHAEHQGLFVTALCEVALGDREVPLRAQARRILRGITHDRSFDATTIVPFWQGLLEQDDDSAVRREAHAILRELVLNRKCDPGLMVPLWSRLLQHERDAAVRKDACEALHEVTVQGFWSPAEMAPLWLDRCRHPEAAARTEALSVVAEIVSKGWYELTAYDPVQSQALGDSDATVRMRAVDIIGELGAHGFEIGPLLLVLVRACTEDSERGVRIAAGKCVRTLALRGQCAAGVAVDAVAPLGTTGGEQPTEETLQWLGELAAAEAAKRLIDEVDSAASARPAAAAAYLCRHLGDARAIERLVAFVSTEAGKASLRKELRSRMAPECADRLIAALADPDRRRGLEPAALIARLSTLLAIDGNPSDFAVATFLMGYTRIPAGAVALVRILLEHGDKRRKQRREGAASALSDFGAAALPALLEGVFEDPERFPRSVLEQAAHKLAPCAIATIANAATAHADAGVRSLSVETLTALGYSPRVEETLCRCLHDGDALVRTYAAKGLGVAGAHRALAALAERRSMEEDPSARLELTRSIEEIGERMKWVEVAELNARRY